MSKNKNPIKSSEADSAKQKLNRVKKLVLLDGNAIIHRSFHALPPFTTKKGELVNAVYGFASTLISVKDKFNPDYIAATFDLKGPTFRHKKFKDYKATRAKAPDELYSQIERVKEVVRAFGIPIYEKEGFEADDIIGTFSKWSSKNNKDTETIIVTGDLDTLQLVDDKTKVYTMSRGISKAVLYDEKAIKERYGLVPEQLKDFKGLRGDASDNIPGVKGIGEKGAINLLKEYGSLEDVYKNIGDIKGALKDKLEKDKIQAFLSKDLGTIKINVPIKLNLEKSKTHEFNEKELRSLFQELGFYSLIKRIFKDEDVTKKKNRKFNPVKSSDDDHGASGVKDFKYKVINDKDIVSFVSEASKQKEIAISIDDLGIAFSWKTGRSSFIKLTEVNLKKIKNILEDNKIKKVGWQLKNDCKYLKKKNINLGGIYFDAMLAAYLLNSGDKIEIERVILEELGEEFEEESRGQISLDSFSSEKKSEKLCQRVDYIWKLKDILSKKIKKISAEQKKDKKSQLINLFHEMEIPLIEVLAEIEINGIKINKIIFNGIAEKIGQRVKKLEEDIKKIAGKEFNVNSTQQLQKVLFVDLEISTQGIKKTKTGYSTAAPELEKLKEKHKIIRKIEEYRELFKLKTTYLDTFPGLVEGDGRIHSTFNQSVTATGRLSSEKPNLQNIPIRTDLGKMIRTAFEAEDGNVLISADYSQIDLRVMAHMSGDKKLMEAFWAGEDIHTKTASEVNKITHSKVTQKMRRQAKALNFGVIYGMGSYGFSQSAEIPVAEAKKFISQYMEEFFGVAEFIRKTKEEAKEKGYVETEAGRRRYLPDIHSPNFQIQAAAERMAINMPIQGLAADIMKLAMIAVYDKYKGSEDVHPVKSSKAGAKQSNGVKMIIQVHDEIILEVKKEKADKIARDIKKIMEEVYKLKVPLVVDTKVGLNWGEL